MPHASTELSIWYDWRVGVNPRSIGIFQKRSSIFLKIARDGRKKRLHGALGTPRSPGKEACERRHLLTDIAACCLRERPVARHASSVLITTGSAVGSRGK